MSNEQNESGIKGCINTHEDGRFICIKQKVVTLKASLMDSKMITFPRDSINRIEEKEKGFLFGLDILSVPLVYFIWRIG